MINVQIATKSFFVTRKTHYVFFGQRWKTSQSFSTFLTFFNTINVMINSIKCVTLGLHTLAKWSKWFSICTRNIFCGTWYLPRSQVHNDSTATIIMGGCITHARNGHISTSALQSDVIVMFLDPDFLTNAKISAIRLFKAVIGLLNICMNFQDLLA